LSGSMVQSGAKVQGFPVQEFSSKVQVQRLRFG
jgi:hypothetical protein